MTRASLFLAAMLAAGGGVVVGLATRSPESPRRARPKAVAEVLRALEAADRGEAPALASALAAAGSATSYESPWREEVALGDLALRGDLDGLWRFAQGRPPSAPRARALVWIAAHARDEAERARARERFRADYPDSWLRAGPASGDGR